MTAHNVLIAALEYVESGMSILPLAGKKPAPLPNGRAFSWARLQVERPPLSHVHAWAARGWLQNVGIVCGAVSGNLAVIDLDGATPVEVFRRQFADILPPTRVVKTGSGQHWYYYVDQLPPTTRTVGYELRCNGCYVVAPPSIHPTFETPYRIIGEPEIARLPDLDNVRQWIMDMIRADKRQPVQGQRTMRGNWAARAVHYEAQAVASAPVNNRNNRLNLAAFNLGQIVADGQLEYTDVESALLVAALASGLGEGEALRTINSGLKAGMQKPRSQQWTRR